MKCSQSRSGTYPNLHGIPGKVPNDTFKALFGVYQTYVEFEQVEGIKEKPHPKMSKNLKALVNEQEGDGKHRTRKFKNCVLAVTADDLKEK